MAKNGHLPENRKSDRLEINFSDFRGSIPFFWYPTRLVYYQYKHFQFLRILEKGRGPKGGVPAKIKIATYENPLV